MKKMLFISNISKRITNFAIPSIEAGQQLGYDFHMAANYSEFRDDESKYNVTIHHIDLVRNPLSIKNIRAYKQILSLLNEEDFDAIHCNTPIGGILGRLCGKKAKVPKILYTVHGFHFYKGASLINRTVFKWAEIWLAHYTDAIITINLEDYLAAQRFKLRKNGEVYYIPGVGIDTSHIQKANSMREKVLVDLGADKDSILMISIGELNKNKNNEVIIKSIGNLQNPKIHYLICGVGDREDELLALAMKENLEQNVHFLGYRTDIPELLKSCDVFIMPSYREGLSRSIMEAMSAGLPCVVSKIRGNVDLIEEGKGGYLRDPNDIDGFAEAIYELTIDDGLRSKMGINNVEKVKGFDIVNIKKKMEIVYERELI